MTLSAARARAVSLALLLALGCCAGLLAAPPASAATLAFSSAAPPAHAAVGRAYSFTLVAQEAGAATRYAVNAGDLPTGMTLDPDSGVLSGTPTTPGTYDFTVEAASGTDHADQSVEIVVESPDALYLAEAGAGNLTVGAPGVDQQARLLYHDYQGGDIGQIAVRAGGDVFAVDSGRVLSIPADGTPPGLLTEFSSVSGLAIGPHGELVVAESDRNRVAVQSADGSTIRFVGGLNQPGQLAIDGLGNIFAITDSFHSVTELPAGGGAPRVITVTADQSHYVMSPAADADGDLVIVRDGDVVEYPADGGQPTVLAPSSNGILSVAFDAQGQIWAGGTYGGVSLLSSLPGLPTVRTFSVPMVETFTSAAPAPTLTAAAPPTTAALGVAYDYTFAATTLAGQPAATFAASGSLPPGLALDPATGELSGTPTTAGTYTFEVRAQNVAHANASGPLTITVPKLSQTITFTSSPAPDVAVGDTYRLAATGGGSGNEVDFASLTPSTCVVSGAVVSLQHTGTCTVEAGQAGATDYTATTARQSFTVAKAGQQIDLDLPADPAIGVSHDLAPSGGASGNPVTITTSTPAVCSVSGTTLILDHAGTCAVVAEQAGSTDYTPAARQDNITVGARSQEIQLSLPNTAVAGDVVGVTATGGGSGNPVRLSTTTGDVCAISGRSLQLRHVGTCTLVADQDATGDWAAGHSAVDVVVERAGQTITFTSRPPTRAVAGSRYVVTTRGGPSGNPVTITAAPSKVCTAAASTVSLVRAGDCVVTAHQAGDADHLAAPAVAQTVTVAAAAPALLLKPTPRRLVFGAPLTVRASLPGNAAGTVRFIVDGRAAGAPAALSAGAATSGRLTGVGGRPLTVGRHFVRAVYSSADTGRWVNASNTLKITIGQAATRLALHLRGSILTATVLPAAPGTGAPTGRVMFTLRGRSVGASSLSGQVALVHVSIPAGSSTVSATYRGSASYAASSARLTVGRSGPRRMVVAGSSTAIGAKLSFTASGFRAHERVTVRIGSHQVAVLRADGAGSVRATVTVPASIRPGRPVLELRAAGGRTVQVTVRITPRG